MQMDIRVEVEDITTVKKKLKVQVPAEVAAREYEQIAQEYRKYARLPGFRPGKAPFNLVKRRFSKEIRADLMQKLVPDSYSQAIKEKGVQPLGDPDFASLTFEEGEPLAFEAIFEVQPEISLPEYKGLKVKAEPRKVSPEEVDAELQKLREQHASLVAVEDRPAQDGDYVVIDLSGEYLEAEGHHHDHTPVKDENVTVLLGDERNHKSFNEALPGMNIAEEKSFEVVYPPEYPEKKLAGHKLLFTAQVTDIKRKVLPELNDEFAKDLGDHETLAELREKIEAQLGERLEAEKESDLKSKLVDRLVNETSFEVPEALIENRIDAKIKDLAYSVAAQGVDPSKASIDWVKVRDQVRETTEQEVRAGIILGEIAREENLQVSDDDLEEEVDRLATAGNQPREKVRQILLQDDRMASLQSQILRRKALQFVYDNAEIAR
jgi:trigger factor